MMKKPQVVARCGDLASAPESTLPAFERAIAKGADAVEFDVHLTKDGELVVHHDFYLGRTDNGLHKEHPRTWDAIILDERT